MKKLSHSLIVIFVAILTSLVLCGCTKTEEMTVTVYGTVFLDSNPLQGASVLVSIRDEYDENSISVSQTVTGSDGTYETMFTINTNYRNKKGWVKATPINIDLNYVRYREVSFSYETSSKVHIDINMKSDK